MNQIRSIKDLAVEHSYYCSQENYYSTDCSHEFMTFQDFLSEWDDSDLDMNMIFRWDVKKKYDESTGEYIDKYRMLLFVMLQRKGIFMSLLIDEVTDEDVPAILEFLKPRLDYIKELWLPLE